MVAPTMLGTLIAAIGGAVYVIWTWELHLWTTMWRVEIMGASVLVLLAYLISWSYLEGDSSLQAALSSIRGEWHVRVAAQTCLSAALVALGIEVRLYFLFFILFFATSICWSLMVRKAPGAQAVRDTLWPEAANVILCLILGSLAILLCNSAVEFEHTVRAFVNDAPSYHTRLDFVRGEVADIPSALNLCIGLMVANLAWMTSRTKWFRGKP